MVKHWLDIRDKPAFLRRLMDEFTGGHMSLEGDLKRCTFPTEVILAHDELGILRRNTIAPQQDFVVLRLEPDATNSIFREVMAAGLSQAIIHVQIEHRGVLQLGAYDNFCRGCVVTGPGVRVELLSELQSAGILRDFWAQSTDHDPS
jgi:hypothetical protein